MIYSLFAFVFGTVFASFAGVCIDRIPKQQDIVKGRSHCDQCGKELAWYDLIPLISYLFQGGKCRYCHAKIPFRVFVIECLGGLLALLCYKRFGMDINTPLTFFIFLILLIIAYIDWDYCDIYTSTVIIYGLLCLLYRLLHGVDIVNMLCSVLIVPIAFTLMNIVKKDSFGFGDIELMAVSGFLLSFEQMLLSTFIGIVSAGLYGSYLLMKKKVDQNAHIAFGPFLIIGIIFSFFFGYSVINTYLGLF